MQETRHNFREALRELERQALGGLDLVMQALDRALEAVSYQDVELEGLELPASEELPPLPDALPNVFSIAEDDEFPASARAGAQKS